MLYWSIVIIVVVGNSFGRRCYEFYIMLHKRFGLSYFVETFLDSSFAANASQAATAVRPALFSQWLFSGHSTAICSTIARELFFSNTSSTHQTLAYAPNMPMEHGAERDQPCSQGRPTWTPTPSPPPTARRRRSWARHRIQGDRTGPGDRPRQLVRTAGGARRARWAYHHSRARLSLRGAVSNANRPG